MPRGAALKIQGASSQTRWTLVQHDSATTTPSRPHKVPNFSMQTTHGHFDFTPHEYPSPPHYDNYRVFNGGGYGSPSPDRDGTMQWEPPATVNGGHFNDYNNHENAVDERTANNISVNTRVRSPNHDAVGRHLLYETAMLDTQQYEILSIDEVDALKKEHERLNSRIEAANRKLMLESKVKDAAQNIQRLYKKKDARPDTPQSPGSPQKTRSSLLGGRGRTGSDGSHDDQSLEQAKDEVAQSMKKVDELNESIKSLLERRALVERKLLRHTAAILAEQASSAGSSSHEKQMNGLHDPDDDGSLYTPNEFDGIRDILHGRPMARSGDSNKLKQQHEQQLASMQRRLERMNAQLRAFITEAVQANGATIEPERSYPISNDPSENLDHIFDELEGKLQILEKEQQEGALSRGQRASEEKLETLNKQIHAALKLGGDSDAVQDMQPPPPVTGHGYQHQLQYLEESVFVMESLLMQQQPKATGSNSRAAELETVIGGLWEIIAADHQSPSRAASIDGSRSPGPSFQRDFSLQAFSSRVQHLMDVASSAKEQQDILRRQIQQQRDLNGKSDMEKDREIAEWQDRHEQLAKSHAGLQDELAKTIVHHQQSEREATGNREELERVMSEYDQLKRVVESRTQDRDVLSQQLDAHHAEVNERQAELMRDIERLESEVVRLTTELTIAKADLEGAYGTRAERQKEAGVAVEEMEALQNNHQQVSSELETLRNQHAMLEAELQEMTQEFQEMTRESLEMEKERGQLEGLIDGLRDRCDSLEAQLSDEKVRWLGMKSPSGTGQDGMPGREAMSVMVLRQEFKRMMREARAEGVRLIRNEQEERRKIEAELRKIRQASGPLGRTGQHPVNGNPAFSTQRSAPTVSASG